MVAANVRRRRFDAKNTSASLPRWLRLLCRFLNSPGFVGVIKSGCGLNSWNWRQECPYLFGVVGTSQRDVPTTRNTNVKAIVNYSEYKGTGKRCVSLDEWREFSGLDRHTIFVDPLYRDTAGGDFRLDAKSPNRGAGVDGKTIGALAD